MRFLLFAICLTYVFALPRPNGIVSYDDPLEDANLNFTTLVQKYGYPVETYEVQTDDFYLLTLHRIPYGVKCGPEKSKGPVLLQHGILSSSFDWIITGPKKGLGYILADLCYDVWLGNSRGNTHSKGHISLTVDNPAYWNFSWHEMGQFDLPAVIDKILHETGKKDLLYVGHSQGTTQFFIFNILHPEYASKVRAMFALAPVAYLGNTQSLLLSTVSKFSGTIGWIMEHLGINEFLPTNDFVSDVGGVLCSDSHPDFQALCSDVLFILCGYDSQQLNATALPVIIGHTPAGSSTKQVLHYAQSMAKKNRFRQYDYGSSKENKDHYGTAEPPDYDISQITIPVAFFYSRNDNFAAITDVDTLYDGIKQNKIGKFLVSLDEFNHLDYLYANDVYDLVYEKMIDLMNRY